MEFFRGSLCVHSFQNWPTLGAFSQLPQSRRRRPRALREGRGARLAIGFRPRRAPSASAPQLGATAHEVSTASCAWKYDFLLRKLCTLLNLCFENAIFATHCTQYEHAFEQFQNVCPILIIFKTKDPILRTVPPRGEAGRT